MITVITRLPTSVNSLITRQTTKLVIYISPVGVVEDVVVVPLVVVPLVVVALVVVALVVGIVVSDK